MKVKSKRGLFSYDVSDISKLILNQFLSFYLFILNEIMKEMKNCENGKKDERKYYGNIL